MKNYKSVTVMNIYRPSLNIVMIGDLSVQLLFAMHVVCVCVCV